MKEGRVASESPGTAQVVGRKKGSGSGRGGRGGRKAKAKEKKRFR